MGAGSGVAVPRSINYSFCTGWKRMSKPLKTQSDPPLDSRWVFVPGEKALRAGLYARVSTHDQKTLPMQLSAMRDYAVKRNWTVAIEVQDVGSGATTRPQREKLIAAARRREIDCVLVWRLDRWGRSRQAAFDNRKLARAGGDPLALKRRPDVPTFAEAAETVIGIHAAGWKDGGKSAAQWRASLRDYAMLRLGRRRVSDITTANVMAVLLPIWNDKRETARRVRQRIGAIMKWAVAEGHRADNPAGEAIGAALPKNGVVRAHQRALPHAEVGAAVAQVRAPGAYAATVLCFEFLTLCAVRSGEARLARWDEVDLEAATWTIPGGRMKAKREHRVPLSGRALEVLHEARALADGSGWVFPSPRSRWNWQS